MTTSKSFIVTLPRNRKKTPWRKVAMILVYITLLFALLTLVSAVIHAVNPFYLLVAAIAVTNMNSSIAPPLPSRDCSIDSEKMGSGTIVAHILEGEAIMEKTIENLRNRLGKYLDTSPQPVEPAAMPELSEGNSSHNQDLVDVHARISKMNSSIEQILLGIV